jgi:DNA-binding MarR family transcriptional regulator
VEPATPPPPSAFRPPRDGLIGLAYELTQSERLLRSVLNAGLRSWGLGYTEFLVLLTCDRAGGGGVPQKELAAAAVVSSAQMSGLVEQLRRRGLLVAERGPHDRRQQLWRLTEDGRHLLVEVQTALAGLREQPGPRFSQADEQCLRSLLEQLRAAVACPPRLGIFAPGQDVAGGDGTEQGGTA